MVQSLHSDFLHNKTNLSSMDDTTKRSKSCHLVLHVKGLAYFILFLFDFEIEKYFKIFSQFRKIFQNILKFEKI